LVFHDARAVEVDQAIVNSVADMWRDNLGIDIRVEPSDLDAYQQARTGQANIFFKGWVTSYNDPDGFLAPLFHSPGVDRPNLNEFDKLVEVVCQVLCKIAESGSLMSIRMF
jgi:ABC-type oligopeptide transport system substrate-binding subunit